MSAPAPSSLAERRLHLIGIAAAQRQALARELAPWRAPLAMADHGLTALRVIRQHPEWLVALLAAYALLRPRGTGRWLRRGWMTWQLVQKLR